MEAARLIQSKNPHSMVEVKDLQSGDVTAMALRPGERFPSDLMSITKEWARADYF
jgi:hypothetical protein